MFANILIVCVGNICRSPTAEYLMRQLIQEQGGNMAVASAGIGALVDKPAAPKAIALAASISIDLKSHRARQLTREMLKEHDLVLVMEQRHIKAVEALAPEARGKVHLLGRWHQNIEIPDPYQKGEPAYALALDLIQTTTTEWVNKLIR